VRAIFRILHYAALAAFLAFALFPLFWLLKVSVTPDDLLYGEGVRLWPSRMTLDHYLSVLRHTQFPLFFRNSLIVASATALFSTAAASAAGYGFSRFRYPGKGSLVGLLLVSQMFPLVIIVAPIFRILAPLGLTNSLAGLIIVYTAFNTPFAAFLMQSFFEAIPKDLEEAALIDGATRFQALRQVILPLTLPALGATGGFVFTAAWSELLFALMLNSRASVSTFPSGLLGFISKFSVDFGQMMAAGVLALLPVFAFFLLIQRTLMHGLTSGAVKG
jgi:multiple sugar transport system permease protein